MHFDPVATAGATMVTSHEIRSRVGIAAAQGARSLLLHISLHRFNKTSCMEANPLAAISAGQLQMFDIKLACHSIVAGVGS